MIMFPTLTSLVLFIFCITCSVGTGLDDPIVVTLLGYSSIIGTFGLLGVRSLILFSQARFEYGSYLSAQKIVLKNIFVLVFIALLVAWQAGSKFTAENFSGLETVSYNLSSLALALAVSLGTLLGIVLIESVVMYYVTYSMKYRKVWFDYFYQADQLPSL
jgi:hypothetical protein